MIISKYIKRKALVLILPFLLFINACDKEDYTIPVEFSINLSIKTEAILDGSITIDEIVLGLSSIDIRGYREQGDDVFLTRNFDQGKNFVLSPASANISEKFDIPQGTYNPISFSLVFSPDAEEEDIIDDILDWLEDAEEDDDFEGLQEDLGDIIEDYLEDTNPCIMVRGKYTYSGVSKNIIIVVNDPQTFQILGNNKIGGAEVTLDKRMVNTGILQINPSYWFSVITPSMLNGAFKGVIDDEEYIFLSKYVNSHIYAAVFNRMEESTTLTINE